MKTRAHQRYKTKAGKIVPGVTTIVNTLGWNKNALVAWARRQALDGNDPDKIKDKAADIGTIAHLLCEHDAKGTTPDLSEYAPAYVTEAEKCFSAYLEWKKLNNAKPVETELQLVSEMGFGGTVDMIYKAGDKTILGDIKTGKGVYAEHRIQVSAYLQLLREHGHNIDEVYILNFSKTGEFSRYKVIHLDKYWEIFKHLLEIYKIKAMI